MPEEHNALRHFTLNNLKPRSGRNFYCLDFRQAGHSIQFSKRFIEQGCQGCSINVTNYSDVEIFTCHQHALMRGKVGTGQRCYSLQCTFGRTRIRMPRQCRMIPGLRRHAVRALHITCDCHQKLTADTLHCLLIETRLVECQTQEVKRLVPVFGQCFERKREIVCGGPEADINGQLLKPALIGLRVHLARPFVQQCRHHVGKSFLAFGVLQRTAFPAGLQHHQWQRMFLHQPGCDPARTRDFLYGDSRLHPRDEDQTCQRQHQRRNDVSSGISHTQNSRPGSRRPVTE